MNIKCAIVDDEPLARKGMMEYVSQVDFLELVGVFDDASQLYPVINEMEIDLIFLDIEMPKLSGIDFARSLKHPPLIIITTAYPKYAVEGYELDVVDYLLKPVTLPRFLKAVNKVKEILQGRMNNKSIPAPVDDHFFVKENGRYTKVLYDEVLYIEALQNYVAIHLSGKKLVSYITLSQLEKQLPGNLFMRMHKSYMVSLLKIDSIQGNMVLIGKERIPVSRTTREQLMQKVLEKKLLRR